VGNHAAERPSTLSPSMIKITIPLSNATVHITMTLLVTLRLCTYFSLTCFRSLSLCFYSIPFLLKITFLYIKTKTWSASCSCLDNCFSSLYIWGLLIVSPIQLGRINFIGHGKNTLKKEEEEKKICMTFVRYYVWLVL
jgi:hypothetical protein